MNVKAKLGGLANCKPWTREEIAAAPPAIFRKAFT